MFKYWNTIRKIKKLKQIPVRQEFLLSLRERLVREAGLDEAPSLRPTLIYFKNFKYAFAFVVVVLFVFSTTGIAFAKTSLPGDFLYPVKIFSENVQEKLILDPLVNIDFQTRRLETRFKEMEELLEKGKNGALFIRLDAEIDSQFTSIFTKDILLLDLLSFEDF